LPAHKLHGGLKNKFVESVSDFPAQFQIFDSDNQNYLIFSDIFEYFTKRLDK